MASDDSKSPSFEVQAQLLPWPWHLPVVDPGDHWIDVENKLLQKYTPSAFLKKWGVSIVTFKNISADLKDPESRAVARGSYRGEHLVAAYKVFKQINRDIRDPNLKMSTNALAHACEETADMTDKAFEFWAICQGKREKFENVVDVLREERRTIFTNPRNQAEDLANEGVDEDSGDFHQSPSPSPSETGSTGSWTLLKGDGHSQSEDILSTPGDGVDNNLPADSPEVSTSQTSLQDGSTEHSSRTASSAPPTQDVQEEVETDIQTHDKKIDGLEAEIDRLQIRLTALDHRNSGLAYTKDQLRTLSQEREFQLQRSKAEIEALLDYIRELKAKVRSLCHDLAENVEIQREAQILIARCEELGRNLADSQFEKQRLAERLTAAIDNLSQADRMNEDLIVEQDYLKFCKQQTEGDYATVSQRLEALWQNHLVIKGDMSAEQLELEESTERLSEENEVLQLQCQSLDEGLEKAKNDKSQLEEGKELYKLKIISLRRKVTVGGQKLDAVQAECAQSVAQCDAINLEKELMQSENQRLKEELATIKGESANAKVEIDGRVQAELAGSVCNLAGSGSEVDRLEREVQRLQEQLAVAREDHEDTIADNKAYEARLTVAEEKCGVLETDNRVLVNENEKLRYDIDSLKTKKENLNEELESIQAGWRSLETQNEVLIAENEELKAEKVDIESELTAVQEQGEELGVEYEGLYDTIEELSMVNEGLVAENAYLKAESRVLESENKSLEAKVHQAQQDALKKHSSENGASDETLQKDKEFYQGRYEKIVEVVEELRKEAHSTALKVNSLSEQLARTISEKEKLEEERTASVESAGRVTRLVEGIHADHGRLIDDLRDALVARDDAQFDVQNLHREAGRLRQEMEVAKWKEEAAREKLDVFKKYLPKTERMTASALEEFMRKNIHYD